MSKIQKLQERFNKPAGWKWGNFRNSRNGTLRYGFLRAANPIATVVFIEGLSEYAEKTFELSRHFNKKSCDFWIFDRHGQGRSERFLKNREAQHSQGFNHDVDDIVQLVKDVIKPDKPVILLGNSVGGMIALMAAHDHPDTFNAVITVAPLFGLASPLFKILERVIGKIPLPKSINEIPSRNDGNWISRNDPAAQNKTEAYSSDPIRNKIHDFWLQNDPELRVGPPTIGWGKQAATAYMMLRKPEYLKKIKQPVLIFTAGKDKIVENKPVFSSIKHIHNVRHIHFKDGKHDLLMESDDIRDPLLIKSMEFIKDVCNNPVP